MVEPMLSPSATDDSGHGPLALPNLGATTPSPPVFVSHADPNEQRYMHDGEEEEKQEEGDEEMALATSARTNNTRSTQRSFGTASGVSSLDHSPPPPAHRNNANHHHHDGGSVTDMSATELYYGTDVSTTDSETPMRHHAGSSNRRVEPPLPLHHHASSTATTTPRRSPNATPVKRNPRHRDNNDNNTDNNNKNVADDDDDEEDVDDNASYNTVELNQKRKQDRRFGCIMFQSGFIGVLIAIALLSIQIVKENNAPKESSMVDLDAEERKRTKQIMKILELPPETLVLVEQAPESPQGMALQWLLDDPWWDTYTYSQDRARQRLCLAALYFATSGVRWDLGRPSDMLSYNSHECEWLSTEHLTCNERYQFTRLDLDGVGLKGTLPEEVWGLMAPRTLQHVALGHNEIRGTLSTQVGMLTQLTHLDLSQTQISEGVPSEIGNCVSLETLSLQSNALLQGTIPTQVGQLTSLKGLWWRNTATRGTIPSELGALQYLEMLELSGNLLTGEIPVELLSDSVPGGGGIVDTSMAQQKSDPQREGEDKKPFAGLQDLRLARNRLTGFIPRVTGHALTTLRTLVLSGNDFDSTRLPSHFANLAKLTSLQVGDCAWTGLIPSELGLVSTLEALGLNGNRFSGTVPTELLQLSQLEDLYLHDLPGLEGRIVNASDDSAAVGDLELGQLTNLKELTINDTPLSGTLPDSLCVISILSFTCFPANLCGCDCECRESSLSSTTRNPVLGSFTPRPTDQQVTPSPTSTPSATPTTASPSTPPTIMPTASLAGLRQAFLQSLPVYSKAGLLDPESPQSYALEWLFADPKVRSYSQLQRIQRFAMAALYGSLYGVEAAKAETVWLNYDTHECFWAGLRTSYATCQAQEGNDRLVLGLYLDPTGMQGSLPPDIALLTGLEYIQGSSGIMSGPLPTELGLLTRLQTLRLPEHQIPGSLPSELGQCTSLRTLDLASNNLVGSLPSELALLSKLESFGVPQNSFVGMLPSNLPHSLKALDLSHNGFSGTIPIPFWALTLRNTLQTLELGQNNLTAAIDMNIRHMSRLSRLGFSGCQLTGALPSEVGALSRLTSLDVSDNGFVDTIPTTVGQLTQLQFLYLNNNNFRGNVPAQLGRLPHLEVLRLHDNDRLSGRIPESFVDLPLNVLTLNETNVAGRIPSGLCLLDVFAYSCSSSLCGCRDCPCQTTLP